jgi:hypothetical protein
VGKIKINLTCLISKNIRIKHADDTDLADLRRYGKI